MLLTISGLLLLCLACLYVAWRFTFPAIVLYAVIGIILGQGLGILDPKETLGDYYHGLIALAVAIILFEGGLHLNLKGLRESKSGAQRLLFMSTPLNMLLNAAAAHHIAGFSWELSWVLAALFIITGPTVVMPLLQQNKVRPKISAMLKWEAIVNDPVGALLTVFAFEYMTVMSASDSTTSSTLLFIATIILIAGAAGGAAIIMRNAFNNGYVPEYLKQPIILTAVITLFAVSDVLQHEGGLIAVTVFGVALANCKFASVHDTKRFKEYIAILLIGIIFILISSTLRFETMGQLSFGAVGFVLMAIFVTRPISVFVTTLGSNMTWREKLFIGWIAPRGIVCAVTAGLIAGSGQGTELELVLPITFLMIFATVVFHGFSMGWLAKKLNLASHAHGVLLVGSNPFSIALAGILKKQNIPVLITDTNWHQLKPARMADIPVYYGEILSEEVFYDLGLEQYSYLILATPNGAYNSLVSENYVHLFGRHRVFQIAIEKNQEKVRGDVDYSQKGPLLAAGYTLNELVTKAVQGWKGKSVNITEEYTLEQYKGAADENQIPLFLIISKTGDIKPITESSVKDKELEAVLISLTKQDEATVAKAKAAEKAAEKPHAKEDGGSGKKK